MIKLFKIRLPSSAGEVKYFGSFPRSSLIWKDEKNQGNLNFSVWELFPKLRRVAKAVSRKFGTSQTGK